MEPATATIRHRAAPVWLKWPPESQHLMVVSQDNQIQFWDTEHNIPISAPTRILGDKGLANLSPDGRFYTLGTAAGQVEVRPVPTIIDGINTVPDWFVDFAEAVSGFRLGLDDRLETIPWDERQSRFSKLPTEETGSSLLEWSQSIQAGMRR